MILTAQRLPREFDEYLVTPENERNFLEEAEKLNGFVIIETEGFFERLIGRTISSGGKSEPEIDQDEA